MEKKKEEFWVCKKCGSKNVEIKEWINPNTNEAVGGNEIEDEDTYCNDCEENTGIKIMEE